MSAPLPKLEAIPPAIATVRDYEAAARDRISPEAWAYLAGGASDETTLAENLAAFSRVKLRARVLADMDEAHCRLELFGQPLAFPVLVAPVAYQRLLHADGEGATALGAAAAKAGMVVSTQTSVAIEDIAAQGPAPLWFQLYVQPDRDFTLSLVRRAEAAGCRAIVLTGDAPVSGLRPREQRAGFHLTPGVEAVLLRGAPPAGQTASAGGPMLLGGPLLAAAAGWCDLAWLRARTALPVLLKGVMTAEDARLAIEAGVDGLVVSNHGGRVLDDQPATLEVLPEIAAAAGRAPVLLDGGVRSGMDVFKALALGARAVLVGRPAMHGLAAAGALGVSHVLHLLRAELEVAMALTGRRTLADIDRTAVRIGRAAYDAPQSPED